MELSLNLSDDELANLMKQVNRPGGRDMLESQEAPSQRGVDSFRNAFIATTRTLFGHSQFSEQAKAYIASGQCFEEDLFQSNIRHQPQYTNAPNDQHLSLPDEHSYRIKNRPWIKNRTWFTKEEREHAGILCAASPLLPLSHIALLSMMQNTIMETYIAKERCIGKGDAMSYTMRWFPANTTIDVVPALSISLLEPMRMDQREKEDRRRIVEETCMKAVGWELRDLDVMEQAFINAKKFLFEGRFFDNELENDLGKIKVICPGKEFMKKNWELQFEIYKAALKKKDEEPLCSLLQTLSQRFSTATQR